MAEIDQAVVERMVALVRDMDELSTRMGYNSLAYQEARAIVAELPVPVDPDLIEARELAVEGWGTDFDLIRRYRAGEFDSTKAVVALLSAIRRGRQLATTEAAAAGEGK